MAKWNGRARAVQWLGYMPAKDKPDRDRDALGENNYDPERKNRSDAAKVKETDMGNLKSDAKGQFAKSQADRKASGVQSASPPSSPVRRMQPPAEILLGPRSRRRIGIPIMIREK